MGHSDGTCRGSLLSCRRHRPAILARFQGLSDFCRGSYRPDANPSARPFRVSWTPHSGFDDGRLVCRAPSTCARGHQAASIAFHLTNSGPSHSVHSGLPRTVSDAPSSYTDRILGLRVIGGDALRGPSRQCGRPLRVSSVPGAAQSGNHGSRGFDLPRQFLPRVGYPRTYTVWSSEVVSFTLMEVRGQMRIG
jgi:hypothetical protein